ncbi:thiamine diphosphokinase [Clostridium arbusti]|uniref:thiamine diphosphokinase n=1 Tax=Clostridium arbusti TaxID=1137848 RepID=UPI000287A4AA|nr:thiamine diphosphokinase [Clostridium arbusti]
MKVLVISGGMPPEENTLISYLNDETYIISADSGANILYKYNILPNMILGDFDSIDSVVLDYFKNKGSKVISYPSEKNFTDTEAAIDEAFKLKPQEILLFGCTGSRVDHTLANIGLLDKCLKKGIKAYIIDENNTISLHDREFKIEGKLGDIFSLQAFGAKVNNLCIIKAKYELYNYDLKFGDPRTVSNELLDHTVSITFDKGIVLLIRARD